MTRIWHERRLEIITLFIFVLLVGTSLFIFYTSYMNYCALASVSSSNAFVHKVTMVISIFILLLSLVIMVLKRDYFFMKTDESQQGLEHLLEEIKYSSEPQKIREFKQMLKEKNHTEVYGLISNMITELQVSKKLADEANEAKTLFLSNISHEIRTPLNGISGFSKILASTRLDNEQQEYIETIQKSSQDLLGVVNNILDVSKIENGFIELEESYFNIFEELANFANLYTLEASKKGIEFLLWIDPLFNDILIQSDAEKIKQILMNLISNAIKFTEQNGQVLLSIKKEASKKGVVSVKFEVIDTGMGIDLEEQKKIFNAFSQGDNSSTRKHGGTGLGLTIAQSWVKMLGGNLTLESVKSKGTTVSFSLNMAQKNMNIIEKVKGLNVALFAPLEVQTRQSNKHLEAYLSQVRGVTLRYLRTFTECKETDVLTLDTLYLHYTDIDKEQLQRIVAQYGNDIPLVLVTKLENRLKILDIAPAFAQILYEPMTFTKIRTSINTVTRNKTLLASTPQKIDKEFNLKALIVEDNRVNQKIILHTLKNLGVESDIADNGAIAVEMFKQQKYDIIFMDIQMPVMNGVMATKEILKYEKKNDLDHTPIVAVTTNTLKGDREQYLASGMDEYIAKPINAQKFTSVIKQFYSTKREEELYSTIASKKTILLYRQTPTEAKIMSRMLSELGCKVDVAKSRVEFNDKLLEKNYRGIVLDRSNNDQIETIIMSKIYENKMQTLLFIDDESEIFPSDLDSYIHLMYKTADFTDVEAQIEKMMES